jgi:hypothetical protein
MITPPTAGYLSLRREQRGSLCVFGCFLVTVRNNWSLSCQGCDSTYWNITEGGAKRVCKFDLPHTR